ncbi:MAG: molybdopterin molybdotransferase MoeA [Xanthobacteraceae bacterium]
MALMPLAKAIEAVLDGAQGLSEEPVALDDAAGRVLARDVAATRTQPPDDMSAMDGYAARAADATPGARLRVIGEGAAGKPFGQSLQAGEAVRIFTGGVIPAGADAVVIQEDTTRDGDRVVVNEAASLGKNIRRAGIDFREGETLLKRAHRLRDRDLALAAAMNHATLPVHRRPSVALLATGDELVMPGSVPGPGQIVYSNGYMLRALARHEGARTHDLGIARDTMEDTRAKVRSAIDSGVDILVTTGGASVGDHDLVQEALVAEGVEMSFWKIAMRPGKPMMHGRRGGLRVLGLPGNPVSSYVCAILFLVPLIRALSGRTDIAHLFETATLGRDVPENDQREDYLRAALSRDAGGALIATPVSHQDSSMLANLSRADALIVRPPHAPAAKAGKLCQVLRLPA